MTKKPDRWIAGMSGLVSLVTLLSLWFSGVWSLGGRMGAMEAEISGVKQRLEGVENRLLSIEEALREGTRVSAAIDPYRFPTRTQLARCTSFRFPVDDPLISFATWYGSSNC